MAPRQVGAAPQHASRNLPRANERWQDPNKRSTIFWFSISMLRAVAIFSLAAAASATTVDPSAGSVSLAAGSATLAISSAGELFTLSR